MLAGPHFGGGGNVNFEELNVISVKKMHQREWWDRAFSKSCTNLTTLIYSPPFLLMLTYGPKHENIKVHAADLDIERFCSKWYRWPLDGPNTGKNRLQRLKSKLQVSLMAYWIMPLLAGDIRSGHLMSSYRVGQNLVTILFFIITLKPVNINRQIKSVMIAEFMEI